LAVAPAAVAFAMADPGSDDLDGLAWAFFATPLGAAAGSYARARQLEAGGVERWLSVVLACSMGLVGLVIGFGLWFAAIERACGDRYECPF
jgi:hypothetical protein